MTIDDWYLKLPNGFRAVYKIIINDKWFYYGSSVDLKRRLSLWKYKFNSGKTIKNNSIIFILPEIQTVRFEIVEKVDNDIDPKYSEDKYLKKYHQDRLCLNMAFDAFKSIKNGKRAYGVKPKEKPISNYIVNKKKIAQYKDGVLIKIHDSVCDTTRDVGIKDSRLSKILKGRCGAYKGFDFKQVLKDGTILDHPIFVPKPRILTINPNPPKPVLQMDKNGNHIRIYPNCRIAAKEIGVNYYYLWSVINQKKWSKNMRLSKTAKGYTFKYA